MKISELKNLTIKELNEMLEQKRVDLSKSKIDLKLGKSVMVHAVKNLKKEIARILTEINIRRIDNKK